MGTNEGAVLSLGSAGGSNWSILRQTDLKGTPYLVTSSPVTGRVVITTATVSTVSDAGDVDVLSSVDYAGLSPGSVVVSTAGDVAVGLRFFVNVLRRDSTGYKQEWYVPSKCAKFRELRTGCECVGSTAGA